MSNLINAAIAQLNKVKPYTVNDELLAEALTKDQKKKISKMPDVRWDIKKDHDAVFGVGNNTLEIPYSRENDEKITSDNYRRTINTGGFDADNRHHKYVFRHLHQNGYFVTDYVGGYARHKDSKPEAEPERIGKILKKTGAHDIMTRVMSTPKYKYQIKKDGTREVVKDSFGDKVVEKEPTALNIAQAYDNDPIRASKKDVKLIVTRSKEGVGGMSTGKGWTSCMNIDDGCNRHKLPHDITQGTLTAYLVRKGDEESLDSPAGRVNIKQFVDRDTNHRIYRAESSVYGAIPASAHTAIKNWAETHYPHKEDSVYSKHQDLYNDDGNSMIITGNPEFRKVYSSISSHVDKIMDSYNNDFHNAKIDIFDDTITDRVHSYLNKLPSNHRDNLIVHARLNTEEDPSDKYDYDKTSEDHIGEWASERSLDWSSIHPKDLMHHLNTAEQYAPLGDRYDRNQLEDATYTHAKLIKEVMQRGDQETKDKTIAHLLDNRHTEWYRVMNDEHSHLIPNLHEHTDSPALINKMYHASADEDLSNIIPPLRGDQEIPKEFAYKIGKYGDDDIIHEYTRHHYFPSDRHVEDFHRGLNERPDGEEMQHKLISELNLGQGIAKFGAVKPITTREQLSYHGPNGNPHRAREEGWEDWGNSILYSGIAKHTKFDSVKKALATRTDTQTHDIQDALKQNTN